MAKSIFIMLSLVFFCSLASAEVYGVMMVVKGEILVTPKGKKAMKAKVGQKVFPGDTITAKNDSRAKIVMLDKNVINISPNTQFLFQKYEYSPDQNKKGALLNVIYGKIRTTVNQKYDGEQNKFQVTTKTSVAGVRGTDFTVSFNQTTNTSKIVTFQGRVEVGQGLDAGGRIMGAVFVSPGQYTVATAEHPPMPPAVVPVQELTAMKQQTLAESPQAEPQAPESRRAPSSKENQSGQTGSHSTLHEMGEDMKAPIANAPPPQMPAIPFSGNLTQNPCPNGQCVPVQVDPSLLHRPSNVIINLQPY